MKPNYSKLFAWMPLFLCCLLLSSCKIMKPSDYKKAQEVVSSELAKVGLHGNVKINRLSWQALEIPDYFQVIKQILLIRRKPMTVKLSLLRCMLSYKMTGLIPMDKPLQVIKKFLQSRKQYWKKRPNYWISLKSRIQE